MSEYTVLFEPAERSGFVVTRPALPGLVTEGDTFQEARMMAHDAIRSSSNCCEVRTAGQERLPVRFA
jgi:hypothetical protein